MPALRRARESLSQTFLTAAQLAVRGAVQLAIQLAFRAQIGQPSELFRSAVLHSLLRSPTSQIPELEEMEKACCAARLLKFQNSKRWSSLETCEGASARPLKMFRFTIRRKPVRRTNIRLLSYASLFSSEIFVSNLFQRTCAMRIHEQRERRVEPGARLKNSRLIGFLEAAPSPQKSEAG